MPSPPLPSLLPPSLLEPPLTPPVPSPPTLYGTALLSDSTSQELSAGAVAGIAVGAVVTTLLLLVVGIYILNKDRASTMVKTLQMGSSTASQEVATKDGGTEMSKSASAE